MGQALLKQQEAKEHIEYLNTLHGNSKGWITKAEKNNDFSQWHYKYKDLIEQDFEKENVYISLNTFYSTYRRIEYLKELKAHFIDLDIHKIGFTKEQVLMNLKENYFNKNVPKPNLIVDSGRGLYLIWFINTVPSKALPLWKAVEEYLYKSLKELGADRMALDPTRVLRVPGSINSKSNTVVEVIEEYSYIYDLREIQNEYLPELKENRTKKKGRPKNSIFIYRERSLYYARIQDIVKLCDLREYDLKGHREVILFLYRYYLCYFTEDVEKALEDVLELNRQFILPLNEREVIRATRSAEKVYLSKDKQYKYKNETLIDILNITEQEEMQLRTIISDNEFKRRKRIRDNKYQKNKYQEKLKAEGKVSKKVELEQIREKIKSLLNQGFSQKDIATKLNIPIRTIERRVKELRTLYGIV